MKVAHISPTYFSDTSVIGGGERYATELSRALALHITTALFTFAKEGKQSSVQLDGNLEMRRYPVKRFVKGNMANPFTVSFLRDLKSFDIVHCYGYPNALTDLCILYSRVMRKKLLVTDIHGGGVCASTYLWKIGIDTRKFIDGFLLLSEYNAQRYRSQKAFVDVIGGGVDVTRFRPAVSVSRSRVLFVGRLIPVKGIDYLIEAVDPDTPLRIVGRPYDQQYLQALRAAAHGKAVEFLTDLADADLVQEYAAALMTVVPSVYTDSYGRSTTGELLGLVALESLACATPVIVTRCGGLPEVVEDGVTGFVVPPNDASALRAKIRYLLDHPELARKMGEAGRKRVVEEFNWECVAGRCIRAYHQALGS